MTTVAVLCDPPRPGLVLQRLVETSPLSETEAAELYAVFTRDVVRAVVDSGGELLVNYRPDEALAVDATDGSDAESEVRAAVSEVVDDARFEVQVGETFAGRAGNTATHLLENEGVGSVAIVRPESAFLARTDIDGAAMKLRSSEVVLGPATNGRVYYAGFTEPIDFTDAYTPPALETLVDHSLDAGFDTDFLEFQPAIETNADLAEAIVQLEARRRANRIVPPAFSQWVAESDLRVVQDDDGLSIER